MGTVHEISEQRLVDRGRVVLGVLQEWGVTSSGQAVLLGLGDDEGAAPFEAVRAGAPMPETTETLRRCSAILTIHRALETLYPNSRAMASYWVTTRNPLFQDRTPLEVMLGAGLAGMERVVEHLNGTGKWG